MPINYVVTKKIDTSTEEKKVLYYASTSVLQNKPINSSYIAEQLAKRSSLQNGDAISVLTQLSDIIATHLQEGRTVSIDGLGNFYPSITSQGVASPEECTADKVRLSRICFKAAPTLMRKVQSTKFVSMQLRFVRDENGMLIERNTLKKKNRQTDEASGNSTENEGR